MADVRGCVTETVAMARPGQDKISSDRNRGTKFRRATDETVHHGRRGSAPRRADRATNLGATIARTREVLTETRNAVNLFRLSGLLDSAPADASPVRLFATIDDDFWLWLHTEGYRRSDAIRRILPGFPAEETQYQYVGTVGDHAMKVGLASSRVFKNIYEQTRGRALTTETSILDLGCGWGRIMRFFLKDIDPARLHGTDVSEEMVAFC